MLFNSLHFVFFFLVVSAGYFTMPHRFRWIWLLSSSCYFYMSFVPVYILILGFTIAVDYVAGIYIERSEGKKRKLFLVLSLIANIGVLMFFKYYNFLNENLMNLLGQDHAPLPYLSILLPIGLSFHTFQAMSYTIEVYRGNQKAEKHFGIYALYVMFYPQLVAGPIERPQNLLHQFREEHKFEYERVVDGLKLMLWGLFMKIVIADRLAIYVDAVYNNSEQHGGKTLTVATIFFAIQIYCDFAGYSNIAIGAAKVMGFKLMTNFNRPYFSRSVSEFWTRWHISLSTWFRDYLYISLGGNKVSVPRWYFNLFIVFLISGFWHGANWTFIAWGALNGFYLIFALVTNNWRDGFLKSSGLSKFPLLKNTGQCLITFGLICLSWVFFRASSIHEASAIFGKIFSFDGKLFYDHPSTILYCLMGISILFFVESFDHKHDERLYILNRPKGIFKQFSYALLLIMIIMIGVLDGSEFIYFQF